MGLWTTTIKISRRRAETAMTTATAAKSRQVSEGRTDGGRGKLKNKRSIKNFPVRVRSPKSLPPPPPPFTYLQPLDSDSKKGNI